MTDNSPDWLATLVNALERRHLNMAEDIIRNYPDEVLSRIRAETAKNSGEVVGWHIAGTTAITKDRDVVDRWNIGNPSAIVEPVYATPDNSPEKNSGEPVAWLSSGGSECFSLTLEDAKRRYGTGSRHIPLYAQPTPANSPLYLTEKQIDAAQFCLSEFFPKTDGVTLRIAAKETVEAALDITTPANSRAEAIGECIAILEARMRLYDISGANAVRECRSSLRALLQQEGE